MSTAVIVLNMNHKCKNGLLAAHLDQLVLVVAQHCIHVAVMVVQSGLDFLCRIITPLYQAMLYILWRRLVLHVVYVTCLRVQSSSCYSVYQILIWNLQVSADDPRANR